MIIAQMVGKNEANRFLEPVLERLSMQVDKIIFTDDCSTDNTIEVASKYAEVFSTNKSMFTESEGNLRSTAWKNLEKFATEGDWIVAIDCDEMLFHEDDMELIHVLSRSPYDVVNVRFYHMWNETQYRVDKLWTPSDSSRIFRYQNGGTFFDKKLACGSEPTYVPQLVRARNFWRPSKLMMQHLGYVRDEDKKSKHERYMTLDAGEFHNINHIQSIADPNPVLMNWNK